MPQIGDVICKGILIKGKQLVNADGNLITPEINATNASISGNLTVCDTVFLDAIDDKSGNGVNFNGDICLSSGLVMKVNNVQVVGSQQGYVSCLNPVPVFAASSLTNVTQTVNTIIERLRAHGLIVPTPP